MELGPVVGTGAAEPLSAADELLVSSPKVLLLLFLVAAAVKVLMEKDELDLARVVGRGPAPSPLMEEEVVVVAVVLALLTERGGDCERIGGAAVAGEAAGFLNKTAGEFVDVPVVGTVDLGVDKVVLEDDLGVVGVAGDRGWWILGTYGISSGIIERVCLVVAPISLVVELSFVAGGSKLAAGCKVATWGPWDAV